MYWLLVVRADLGAKRGDLDVLKGRRIGAAPGPDLALRRLLAEADIDIQRDQIEVGPIPGAGGPTVSFGVAAARALGDGKLDAFWANAMGAEVAVRRGVGTVLLDVRRGDGPPRARAYTFPAVTTTEERIRQDPESAAAVVRAVVQAQKALQADVGRATEVGRRLFPTMEAELIAGLVERDLPYYTPQIAEGSVRSLNQFAQDVGLLSEPVAYEQVVATAFVPLWRGGNPGKQQPREETRASS